MYLTGIKPKEVSRVPVSYPCLTDMMQGAGGPAFGRVAIVKRHLPEGPDWTGYDGGTERSCSPPAHAPEGQGSRWHTPFRSAGPASAPPCQLQDGRLLAEAGKTRKMLASKSIS